jgi:hypothetical protein
MAAALSGAGAPPTSPTNAHSSGANGAGSSTPSNNNDPEIEGTIGALPPATPALTLTVAGTTVVTTSSTVFLSGDATKTFADLKVGMKVDVHGTLAGNTLTANRVQLEDAAEPEPAPVPNPPTANRPTPNPPTPNPPAGTPAAARPPPVPVPAELHGTIAGLTGTASAFQFMLGKTLVKGDASTGITGDGDDGSAKTFANLKNGAAVEVNGTQQTGFVQAVRIHVEGNENEPGDGGDNGNNNGKNDADIEGTLGPITGTCPAISSTVGTTKIATTASTKFDGVACTAVKVGIEAGIKGTGNADGSITATTVERND